MNKGIIVSESFEDVVSFAMIQSLCDGGRRKDYTIRDILYVAYTVDGLIHGCVSCMTKRGERLLKDYRKDRNKIGRRKDDEHSG